MWVRGACGEGMRQAACTARRSPILDRIGEWRDGRDAPRAGPNPCVPGTRIRPLGLVASRKRRQLTENVETASRQNHRRPIAIAAANDLDEPVGKRVLPHRQTWTIRPPRVDRLGVRARALVKPGEQLERRSRGGQGTRVNHVLPCHAGTIVVPASKETRRVGYLRGDTDGSMPQ
jgi:hypothetical protein